MLRMEFQIDRRVELKTQESEDLKRYFYLSFRYSQGSHELQEKLFTWTGQRNLYKNIPTEISPNFLEQIKIPITHQHEESAAQRGAFQGEWYEMSKLFNGEKEVLVNPSLLLRDIVTSMAHRDIVFSKDKIRHTAGMYDPKNPDSASDPRASFIRRYSILKKPTGHVEFDELFNNIREVVMSKQYKSSMQGSDLVKLWEKNHLGHKFYLGS